MDAERREKRPRSGRQRADVPFPSELIVTQSAGELSVKGSSVRQNSFAAVYKLDGSRVNIAARSGITQTAEARFEEDTPP